MEQLIKKYPDKLADAGLVIRGEPLLGFLDADILWNRGGSACDILGEVLSKLSINSILFSPPAEPYKSIIEYLASTSDRAIFPKDCETRTFIHDLPLGSAFDARALIETLKRRKCIILPKHGIVTFGTVSPQQAFIVYSSVCFAVFVKFFSDYLSDLKNGCLRSKQKKVFNKIASHIAPVRDDIPKLANAPFETAGEVIHAMDEAGKKTVDYQLVDSFFGNISYRLDDTIYISQTSSSLDELAGCIDPCPLDSSSCAAVTASSELTAHREVFMRTNNLAILHGHPKFSVIMSMDCQEKDCKFNTECFRRCPQKRFVNGVPIVPGEVGTGKFGLCNTIPDALTNSDGVIVYGHGVFAVGKNDFNDAFKNLLTIENNCREEFFKNL